jgi:hypothetical protein
MRPFAIVRYLLVPLNLSTVLSIVYFAVALTAGEHAGVAGIFVVLGAGLLFFAYAFALLDHVHEGRTDTFVLSTDVISAFAIRSVGTLVLVVLLYYVTGRLQQWFNPAVVLVLRLMLLALFPVVVAGMIMTGRFLEALNPVTALGTIARIPASYAALVLIICAIWAYPLWVVHESTFSFSSLWRMESFLPTGLFRQVGARGLLIGFLSHLVALYLWLATFACIGGTLYERRWELDIRAAEAPERETERANVELEKQQDALMDQLHSDLRCGAVARASESVRKRLAESPEPLDEGRWLYARTAQFADQRLANSLAQFLLPLLLKRGASGEALKITRQRLTISKDFRPQTRTELLQLVEAACSSADRATARELLVDLSRHYGGDPLPERLAHLQREFQQR